MTDTNIYPYGQSAEMPNGYPIANNLVTNSARIALAASMGIKLSAMAKRTLILVAASDAPDEDKLAADFQCTGTNDELVIQQAVNAIYAKHGGTILLSKGTFYIDSFPNYDSANDGGSYIAVNIPADDTLGYEIHIIGDSLPYSSSGGTMIYLTNSCYESLSSSTNYKIFSTTYFADLIGHSKVSVFMLNMRINLPANQKKIMCIDMHSANRVYLQFISCSAYRAGYNGYNTGDSAAPLALPGCIGIRMTSGSNYGTICDYRNIGCSGFYEAFQVGGEHVVGINLSGIWNVYSYTFGNYPWTQAFHHPITLINCCDERSVNLPLFAYCSANRNNGEGGQQVSLIDFNLERYAPQTPGGVLGDSAKELVPGTFHGEISYTIQRAGSNVGDIPFWKDGHGQRFITRNSAHRLACSTTVRNGYAPNYLQRIWDTTLGKEVICVDTANKTWKDPMGNIV